MKRMLALVSVLCVAPMLAELASAATAPARRNNAGMGVDSNQPIAVNADSFLADLNGETGTYSGNVIITQGSVRLHADQVKVTAPGGQASKMEATGHVVVDSPSGQAVGDMGVYDVPTKILRLNGHVVLTKEQNVMRGSTLEVAMATGIARLTAGAEPQIAGQPAQPPGRVQALFVPAQRAPAPANGGPAAAPKP